MENAFVFNDDVNVDDIPGNNPSSFGRNVFWEMFDDRMDLDLTDDATHPTNSTRISVSIRDCKVYNEVNYEVKNAQPPRK